MEKILHICTWPPQHRERQSSLNCNFCTRSPMNLRYVKGIETSLVGWGLVKMNLFHSAIHCNNLLIVFFFLSNFVLPKQCAIASTIWCQKITHEKKMYSGYLKQVAWYPSWRNSSRWAFAFWQQEISQPSGYNDHAGSGRHKKKNKTGEAGCTEVDWTIFFSTTNQPIHGLWLA